MLTIISLITLVAVCVTGEMIHLLLMKQLASYDGLMGTVRGSHRESENVVAMFGG